MAGSGPPARRSRVSRWLWRVDRYASGPPASVLVIGAAAAWVVVSIGAGFPAVGDHLPDLVAALTLVMVFVIQHTQSRHQRATQRKLDETLLAMPGADNSLFTLEHASDEELAWVHLAARRTSGSGAPPVLIRGDSSTDRWAVHSPLLPGSATFGDRAGWPTTWLRLVTDTAQGPFESRGRFVGRPLAHPGFNVCILGMLSRYSCRQIAWSRVAVHL